MSSLKVSGETFQFDRTSRAILGVFATTTGILLLTVVIVASILGSSSVEGFSFAQIATELQRRTPAALVLGLGISLYLTATVLLPLGQQARRRAWARSWHAWVLAGGLVTLPVTLALQFVTSGDRPFVDLGGLLFLFLIGAAAGLAGYLGIRRKA